MMLVVQIFWKILQHLILKIKILFHLEQEKIKIDLTEYYDLIYEYKNDCLVAGIRYNKTYYKDRDLEPTEDYMFSIKLVPLTSIEQKFAN